MIEVKGNELKSVLFNRLIKTNGTAGIIFDDRFIIGGLGNVWLADEPEVDEVCKFITEELSNFKEIVIYSNYHFSVIKPFIDAFKNIEKNCKQRFIVMYRS